MSKRVRERKKRDKKPERQAHPKLITIGCALLCLVTAVAIMAQWKMLPGTTKPMALAPTPSGSLNANSPSKEYIYAGGRLIATEEPAASFPPPTVSITAPSNGSSSTAPATVTIDASATAASGATLTKVEFYQGTTMLGEDTSAPYSYAWTNVTAGSYSLTAKATDSRGMTAMSTVVSYTVGSNLPPTVALTAPANNSSFITGSNIQLTANSTDTDGTVSKVEFYQGQTYLGEDSSAPYSFTWTNVGAGSYSITAKAIDNAGAAITSSASSITVTSNAPPTVSITAPTNSSVFAANSTITINTNAADTDGTVSKVEFFQGSTKLGEKTSAPFNFSWANVSAGSHALTAVATDNGGAQTPSATVNIRVNAPPAASISAPAGGTIFTAPGNITVNATASDSDGSINKVEFYQGATKIGEDTSAPYSFSWENVAAGSYSLTVKALDNDGATTTSAAKSVTVNAPPTATVTSPAANTVFTTPASITITATASDSDGSIDRIEFYNGTTLLGQDTSAPYSYAWTNVAAGSYNLTVKTIDNNNATTTSGSVNIIVNAPPAATVTSPAANTVFTAPANITIAANATDSDGTISKVEFYQGATLLGDATSSPYSFNWTNVPAGTYSLTAKAIDNRGAATTSAAVSVTVNALPTVSVTAPANNAIFVGGSTINITADAADSDGTIAKVEFYQGTTLLGEDTIAPYAYDWTGVAEGNYVITAKAIDNQNGATTSGLVNVMVVPEQSSISLDGTNSYVDVANSTSLNVTGAITLEAWVKTNSSTGMQIILTRSNWSQGQYSYDLMLSDGKLRFDVFHGMGDYKTVIGNSALSTGVWHHVAGVADGAQLRVYVNGVLDGNLATDYLPANTSAMLRIGRETNPNNVSNFNGLIDNVRVSDVVRYVGDFIPEVGFQPDTNTKGLWKFNAGSAADSSLNGNTGTLNGGASYSATVPSYNSLSLSGTSVYVQVPNSASLNITGAITLEAWVKTNSATATQVIVSRGDWSQAQYSYDLMLIGGKARFNVYRGTNDYKIAVGATDVTPGVWHHVAGVADGSQMRIYLDGVLDGTNNTNYLPQSSSTPLRIGRDTNLNDAKNFNGLIDEVRVSAGVLYAGNFTPALALRKLSSTKGLWRFNDKSPNDASGNGNNGAFNGTADYFTGVPSYSSLSLNGTNAYAQIPNSASLNITGPITLEAWIKSSSTANQAIAERYGMTDGGYILRVWQGKLGFWNVRDANNADGVFSTSPLTANVWHHVAGVYDGTQMRVYIDGVLEGSKTAAYAPASGTSNLFVGANPVSSSWKFNGLIDEVRVSAGALYSGNFTLQTHLALATGTAGLWRFDDQTINDASGNANHGTIQGGLAFSTAVVAEPVGLVAWTNASANVTPTGSSLLKPSGFGWDAGAVSSKAIASGNGYVEFTATETNTHRLCGLSNGDTNQSYTDIDFAVYLDSVGGVNVYEGGIYRGTFGSYNTGDRLRVEVMGGKVYYSKNGVVFYINSTPTITYPLLVDTSLYSPGATVTNTTLSGTLTP